MLQSLQCKLNNQTNRVSLSLNNIEWLVNVTAATLQIPGPVRVLLQAQVQPPPPAWRLPGHPLWCHHSGHAHAACYRSREAEGPVYLHRGKGRDVPRVHFLVQSSVPEPGERQNHIGVRHWALLWANPLEADSVHAGRADLAARWRDGVWNHPSTPEPRLETSHDCYHPMENQQHRGNRKLHGPDKEFPYVEMMTS